MTKLLLPNSKLLMNIFANEWKDISFKIETFMPQQVMKNFFWNCPHVRSYQVLFFYLGIATFTLTCQAKGGNAGTQLIPEEASLKCKSNSEAENKVSYYCFSISQQQHHAKWLLIRAESAWDIAYLNRNFFLFHYQMS